MEEKHGQQCIYPMDGWQIIEDKFSADNNYKNESIFALGNGYIGLRGDYEENYKWGSDKGCPGTYINGFYDTKAIEYGEPYFGSAQESQTMLNVANGKVIKLYVGDEEFDMRKGEIIEYKRVLDLKEGVLKRHVLWCSGTGRKVSIDIIRMASMTDRNLAAISYEVIPINFSGIVSVASYLDGDVSNHSSENDPRVGAGFKGRILKVKKIESEENYGQIIQETSNTKFELACAMENNIETSCEYDKENICEEFRSGIIYRFNAEKGSKIRLDKYISYITSLDSDKDEIGCKAYHIVSDAKKKGFWNILKEQHELMKKFWQRADISVEGDVAVQQSIRFNMFHLFQSAGRDGKTSIAAKGLTGEGYGGQYFWDTEIFIHPFFLYTCPHIAKKFLEYRYSTLDDARERARQLSLKGALFSWRTIAGEECSAYFPAGTAQYHIDADIAYAVIKYIDATEDMDFLTDCGAEILFETARMWVSLGSFIEHKENKFCINCVTGPDEYTAIVNNNYYTNLMAKINLQYAYDAAMWMKENRPEEFLKLAHKTGFNIKEADSWKKAADNMYLPYDKSTGIYLQDDAFLDKEPWNFENTPKDKYPLLLHYHPLVIYRHQVCKQADMILAMFLSGHKFSLEDKKKNLDFYEKLTTHDSSLSECVFSIACSEAGYHDKAYRYFNDTIRMDLDDFHGNTKDGVHMANMAGAWMCIVNGFAGMRTHDGILEFKPYLPDKWVKYSFKINYKNRLILITIDKKGADYQLLEGDDIEIINDGKKLLIKK